MSDESGYRPWFERYPQLFKKQADILIAAGYEGDKERLAKGYVCFKGRSKVDPERQLLVLFPQAFPSCAPKFFDFPPSKLLTRHHRIDNRQLCLFGFSENRWNATLSVADALQEAEQLISEFKEENKAADNQPPEPITRAIIYMPETAILVPPPISTFKDFDQLKSPLGKFTGKFAYEGDSKKETKGRGIILQAEFGAKKYYCHQTYSDYFKSHGKEINGDWFYLKTPPSQESLQSVLNQCFEKARALKRVEYYWFGLVFNEETGRANQFRLTWLLARAHIHSPGKYQLIRTFPYIDQERNARIPGLGGLAGKRIIIIGCGSLGSKIAANLAASGVNSFTLVDCDYYEPNNSVRHELGVENFGLNKEKALLTRLCSLNPSVSEDSKWFNFQVGGANFFEPEQHFVSLVKESDLIIDTSAIHSVSHFVNELAFDLKIPALFATVTNGAWGGEAIRVVPGKTPCWVCWLEQYYKAPPPSAPESTAEVFAPGCDQPTFTGATYELGMVANLATAMAVDTLLGSKDFSKNYIRWSGKNKAGQPIYLTDTLPTSHQKECYLCGS